MLGQLPAIPSLVLFGIDGVLWQRASDAVGHRPAYSGEVAAFPDVQGILACLRHKDKKVGVAGQSLNLQATQATLFKLSAESFQPAVGLLTACRMYMHCWTG